MDTAPSHPAAAARRCLLVEDEDDIREALTFWIEMRGWEVVAVSSVPEAREALSGAEFHLVVTDFTLPGGTGSHVVDAARQSATPAPVCIVVSGVDAEKNVRSPSECADHYLPKPFSLDVLAGLLDSIRR